MRRWLPLAAICALALLPGCVGGPRLAYDYRPGQAYAYRAEEQLRAAVSIYGAVQPVEDQHVLYYELEQLEGRDDRARSARVTCRRFISQSTIPGRPRSEFDSQRDDPLQFESYAPMALLIGQELTVSIDQRGVLTLLSGADQPAAKIVERLGSGPAAEQVGQRLAAALRPDFLPQLLHLRFPPLPDRRPALGARWEAQRAWDDPLLGRIELEFVYELTELRGDLAVIKFSANLIPALAGINLPGTDLNDHAFEVELGEINGTLILDTDQGVIVSLESLTRARLLIERSPGQKSVGLELERRAFTERQ